MSLLSRYLYVVWY